MPDSISVGGLAVKLERVAMQVDTHITECAAANLAAAKTLEKIADKVESIEKAPMRLIIWIGTIVITGALSVGVQNFFLHEDTSEKATVAAQAATDAAHGQEQVISKLDALTPKPHGGS